MFKRNSFTTSKILPTILITLVFVSVFSVNSFAASAGNLDFYANDCYYYSEYYDSQNGVYVSQNVVKSITSFSGVECVQYTIPRASGNYNRFTNIYDIKNLHANHEYTLRFSYFLNPLRNYGHLLVTFQVLNANGSPVQSQVLYTGSTGINALTEVEFNFVPDLSNVQAGYQTRLNFEFIQESNTQEYNCLLSNYIYFNDNDDDSGWFQQIVNWLQNVVDGITNAASSVVSSITTLKNNIDSYITSLSNNINTWLTNLKNGLIDKLQSVQAAITSAIDGIEQWFIDLGTEIGNFFTMLKNYILYFQHPVTLNSDGVPVDSNGNPVYTNPFTDTLDSLSDTLNDTFDDLDGFILTIQSVNVQITGYLQTFTTIFNRFNASVPIFAIIIVLAFIIIVIKKIMGR